MSIPDELGPMPAWSIPIDEWHTWAIFVHGINGSRNVGLRIAPTLHADGLPTLLITYREDLGAPASPDGLHHMGLTEWRDLAAAARYALSHGAQRLVLVGYSMGGAIVTQFMEHSPLAADVSGLVLDSPALDWKAILSFNATEMGLPSFAADPVEWMIDARIDPDWNSLDALQHPGDFHLPILLFHGTEDKLVPIATSNRFAAELPPLGHLLPRAARRAHRVLERRPRAVRPAAHGVPDPHRRMTGCTSGCCKRRAPDADLCGSSRIFTEAKETRDNLTGSVLAMLHLVSKNTITHDPHDHMSD